MYFQYDTNKACNVYKLNPLIINIRYKKVLLN